MSAIESDQRAGPSKPAWREPSADPGEDGGWPNIFKGSRAARLRPFYLIDLPGFGLRQGAGPGWVSNELVRTGVRPGTWPHCCWLIHATPVSTTIWRPGGGSVWAACGRPPVVRYED